MRVKVFIIPWFLCVFGVPLFAQESGSLAPLSGRSEIGYLNLIQQPSVCACWEVPLLSIKSKPTLSIDIPISPFWDTAKEDRIANRTLQFGGSATPLKDIVMFGGWLVPKVNFTASDFRITVEAGIMKALNVSPSRIMEQARGNLEGSFWFVLMGADSFFGQEKIPSGIKGLNFDADFRRRSIGGQGWLGIKIGDFNQNFIAGRYGNGYVQTEGENHFNVSGLDNLDWFPLYVEEFRIESFSVDGQVKIKKIRQSARFDKIEYERVIPSPDSSRFGENRLYDMFLKTETEIMPLSHVGVVLIWTKDFRDQNRLIFINDYSSIRIILRLAFN